MFQPYCALETNLLASTALTLVNYLSCIAFLTISLSTTLLSLLKSAGAVFTLSVSISSASAGN